MSVNIDIHTEKIEIQRTERDGIYGRYACIHIYTVDRKGAKQDITLYVGDSNDVTVRNDLTGKGNDNDKKM